MEKISLHNLPRFTAGFVATLLSINFMVSGRGDIPILFASAFLLLICISDTLYTKIPNLLTFSMALAGFGYNAWLSGGSGFFSALLGLTLGLGLFLVPFLMGGMGAGDVKALAALGALLGPIAIFHVFLYTALFGGIMAVFQYLSSPNLLEKMVTWRTAILAFAGTRETGCLQTISSGEKLKFPYATVIAFGYYTFLAWGDIFSLLLWA
jgi:prepilin peptidase CpaA